LKRTVFFETALYSFTGTFTSPKLIAPLQIDLAIHVPFDKNDVTLDRDPALQATDHSIFTIGHSTHTLDRFLELLARHEIECLADVRLIPRSRRMPHFSGESLGTELPAHRVRYLPLRGLGGRRRPRSGTPNTGWRVTAFRGYADHMETEEFGRDFARLEDAARAGRTAVMCAEGLWWRCHRRLISDALLVRGRHVVHIAPDGSTSEHVLTEFAVVEDGRLTYPPGAQQLELHDS
jgi:uncharacterized protein DUF488